MLQTVASEDRWRGAISNISTEKLSAYVHQASTLEHIEREHPRFPENFAEIIVSYQVAWTPSAEPAPNSEVLDLQQTENILNRTIEGDIGGALAAMPTLLPHRRTNLLLVMVVELYRRDRHAEAEGLREKSELNDEWDLVHLAWGAAGRVPWLGYPYPDY